MGWLVTYTLASMATAFVVLKIFDSLVAGAHNGLVSSTRAILFIVTWTAVTAIAAMRGFSKRVRQLRLGFIKHILH